MTIDYQTIKVRVYTCCKCKHQWINWDNKTRSNGHIPVNCPSCRNIRWNQTYTDEDLKLVERLENQHIIKLNAETKTYEDRGRYDIQVIKVPWSHFDFIAHDFLYKMLPSPEIHEIKSILQIPVSKIELRHESMLSILHDRIDNAVGFEQQYFAKYSKWFGARCKRRWYDANRKYKSVMARRRMKGCKHEEDLKIIMALYRDNYRKKLEIEDAQCMPGAEAIYAKADRDIKAESIEAAA